MPITPPLLFTNAAGTLATDPAGFLRVVWPAGPRTLADTQALFGAIAEGLEARGWGRVLVHQVAMQPFSAAEQQWVAHEWLPVAVRQSGYRYGAVIVSTDAYTRLATAYITTSVSGLPLRYRSFDAEAEAVAWLRRQPV
jgi:hypothetical protein